MRGGGNIGTDSGYHHAPGASGSQTDWSLIGRAASATRGDNGPLEAVARRYWPAAYAFCRSSGLDHHDAADATQSFICEIVLERDLLNRADRRRGRFRALLLTALRNHIRDRHRRATRRHRAPDGARVEPLAVSDDHGPADPRPDPERAFTTQWAVTLVRSTLDQVRRECIRDGLDVHWRIFELRVARPMLTGQPAVDYATLVARHRLGSVGQAANMLVTVKRRVAAALREEVARTVDGDDEDVQLELRQLVRELGWPA